MPCTTVQAELASIPVVTEFVDNQLRELACPVKSQTRIDIVIDELLSNIARYAYPEKTGTVKIETAFSKPDRTFTITFTDSGIAYNPLEKEDPDISLGADEREAGGLGIFMVKKMVDEIAYKNEDGKNILKIVKII